MDEILKQLEEATKKDVTETDQCIEFVEKIIATCERFRLEIEDGEDVTSALTSMQMIREKLIRYRNIIGDYPEGGSYWDE